MSEPQNSDLLQEKVGRLMRKFSIPCVVSLLVGALYNIVDQLYIANASYLGSNGNAANTVVFPLTVVALAFAVLIGDGCCAFVSIRLGAGEREDAHRSVGNAVVLSAGGGILLMLLYFAFRDPLLRMFGGAVNAETFAYAREYFLYITMGIPVYVFGQAMNPVIRADGSPRFAMAATLSGAILNTILDPVAIFALHWGMMGAAVATVAGQLLTAVLSAAYLFRMKSVRLRRGSFRLSGKLIGEFVPLGICSFLSQISLVASMAAVNNMIRKYSLLDPVFSDAAYAQIPMAVVGIVMKFFQIVISVVVGIAAGCIPIVGYNIGAKRKDRALLIFRKLLSAETIVGAAALAVAEGLPRLLIGAFGAAGESPVYTAFALRAFRIYLCMLVLACVNKASFIFLQSLGKAWESTFLSILRELVLGVSLALILPRFLGLDGVLWSMPAADLLAFFATVFLIRSTRRELQAG